MAKVRTTRRVRRRESRPDCVFCRIVAGKAPASTVFEDGRVLAFMDANPVRRGHVLVIPKAHRAQIWAMADAEFAAVYRTLPRPHRPTHPHHITDVTYISLRSQRSVM
jgi:histidine triad (HIT) family protein